MFKKSTLLLLGFTVYLQSVLYAEGTAAIMLATVGAGALFSRFILPKNSFTAGLDSEGFSRTEIDNALKASLEGVATAVSNSLPSLEIDEVEASPTTILDMATDFVTAPTDSVTAPVSKAFSASEYAAVLNLTEKYRMIAQGMGPLTDNDALNKDIVFAASLDIQASSPDGNCFFHSVATGFTIITGHKANQRQFRDIAGARLVTVINRAGSLEALLNTVIHDLFHGRCMTLYLQDIVKLSDSQRRITTQLSKGGLKVPYL